jgi:hypothetical protein
MMMRSLMTLAAVVAGTALAHADAPIDLASELKSIAAKLAPRPTRSKVAPPACTVTTPAERTDANQRALAWIDSQHPDERGPVKVARDDSALVINVGCKDSTGAIILDVSQDRQPAKRKPDAYGTRRNYLMRVTSSAVEVLAEDTSTLSENWMEWADEGRIALLAQVDMDGDGALDIVYSDHEHEGGSMNAQDHIHVRYATGKVGESGMVDNLIDVEVVANLPVVGGQTREGEPIYACLQRDLHLAPCAASARLQKEADRIAVLDRYSQMGAGSVPDRDQLAQELATLGITGKRKAALVAAAPETTPADRAARKITAFLVKANLVEPAPMPDVIRQSHAEGRTYLDDLATKLGDTPCTTTPLTADDTARATAWVRKQDAKAIEVQIAAATCGPYVWANWSVQGGDKGREVMLGRDGTRILGFTYVLDQPPHEMFEHVERWFSHGGSVVGIAMGAQNLWVIADGKVVAQTKGDNLKLYAYDDRWSETSGDVFVDGGALWHATPTGRERLDLALVRDHEARRAAIALLSQPPPTRSAKYIAALQLLGADKALVAEVKKLP